MQEQVDDWSGDDDRHRGSSLVSILGAFLDHAFEKEECEDVVVVVFAVAVAVIIPVLVFR